MTEVGLARSASVASIGHRLALSARPPLVRKRVAADKTGFMYRWCPFPAPVSKKGDEGVAFVWTVVSSCFPCG